MSLFKKVMPVTCFLLLGTIANACLASLPAILSMNLLKPHDTKEVVISEGDSQTAKLWHLDQESYEHYQWLMQHTPNGHWYQHLDPAEVLALNTKDDKAMMHYATLEAELMHHKVGQELLFNKLYAKAYQQRYPNEKPAMPPNAKSATVKPGDRVWLFTAMDNADGTQAYLSLKDKLKTLTNVMVDIYFVGKHVTKQSISEWARSAGIAPDNINKTVTLNFGNDRFNDLPNAKQLKLPYIGLLHDGHFQPLSLTHLNSDN